MKSKQTFLVVLSTIFFLLSYTSLFSQSASWQKLYGFGFSYESAKIDDETFYICGSRLGGLPAVVMKINQYGETIWEKEFANNQTSYASSITVTDDNGCVVAGYAQGHKALWKYDSNGNLLWLKTFEGYNEITKLIKIGNEFFAAAGNNIYMFDANGNQIWQREFSAYPGLTIRDIYLDKTSKRLLSVGDFLFQYPVTLGFFGSIDLDGSIINTRTYKFLEKTTRFNFIKCYGEKLFVAGFTVDSGSYQSRIFFHQLKTNGDIEYTKMFPPQSNEVISSFIIRGNNSIIFSSHTGDANLNEAGKIKFIMTDFSGNITRIKEIESDYTISVRSGISFNSNGIIFTGYKLPERYNPSGRMLVIKTDSMFNFTTVGVSNNNSVIPDKFSLAQNYPNPFNPSTVINYRLSAGANISMNLYDISGRFIKVLESGYKLAGNYGVTFSGEGLSSGIYYYSLTVDGAVIDTKKAILLK